ncbi:tRNA pseudouridine32 synthase / 23S rRNA pseudouridine746 synthase [Lentzea albidocapillata subsp. violacea]|uniref:RNA pseudouridylate synthase n=1 Tax=Lentzea albidocapillata subsp. violacea TaxID=128104 RepID=A0A1G9RFD3_9PSEU|nr:RluA family pseudouridine synthase [Lentzea albidocapillata]SDM21946.1 tRNA pseudouridine32 synthase / 23S rRNA pseudouridine746 synthase [Lentzea albidocapillata subsp. violacea]
MRRKPSSPLPQRNGLDAARLKLPSEGAWPSLREHLVERLPRVAAERIDEMLAEERIWGVAGPLGVDTPFVPDSYIWFHRDLPVEVPVPFEVGVVHQDDDIVVADKPHFLATIPRGAHIMQTALVKLRESLGLPDLSPAHRLDRVTAGLVLFVVRRELRGKYQTMFRDRLVRKEYEAIAPYDPALELPRVVRSRIIKERGIITAFEVDGEPNAETQVSLVERRGALGRYHLKPLTGRTHQLRLHMSGLGVPIVNDDFYPVLRDRPLDDFSSPLQLLAHTLSFVDPVSGIDRSFTSGLKLSAWS